jgi:8-oxo-dGTP pyrophosphatase MutT (NUDIX family)
MEVKRLIAGFTNKNLKVVNTNHHYKLSDSLRRKSEDFWQDYLARARKDGIKIWEGIVYRVEKLEKTGETYKIFLGTLGHRDTICTGFLAEDLEKMPFEERPNGMYVSCFLKTSDGKFIFGSKKRDGIYKYKIIGGVLNQDETEVKDADGFVEHFLKEFEEETGLSRKYVERVSGAGMFLMTTMRINVCLRGDLSITFDEFLKKAKPNYEHESFVGLVADEILEAEFLDDGVKSVFKSYTKL